MIHPQIEQLETYALGRVADLELAALEEHLLVCPVCLDWVQAQEHTVRVMCHCLLSPLPKRVRKPRAVAWHQGWLF